ncbi:MAG: hypothetical protein IPL79_10665 [Myxococcales bacterium]|nr:hypothetical protein [Myxococcales bacterium]
MWQPIITGVLAERAAAAVADVVAALREVGVEQAGVESSPMDVALAWAYLSGETEEDAEMHEAAALHLMRQLGRPHHGIGLFGGATGTAWAIAHMGDDDVAELLQPIDDALVAALKRTPWSGHFDLISGLAGIAVYALERWERGEHDLAKQLFEPIVARLRERAHIEQGRYCWLGHKGKEVADCGLAHGALGVIVALARMTATGAVDAGDMVKGASEWLFDHIDLARADGCVPYSVTRGTHVDPGSRLGWCYGDLGAAAALWNAQRRLGGSVDRAHELAMASVARSKASSGVNDAGLCHGSVGNAHIFARLYHASGDATFKAAAERWYEDAFSFCRADLPYAGWGSWGREHLTTGEFGMWPKLGWLEGAIGIAMGFHAATSEIEPRWDTLLGVDIPMLEA